jgi:hypothetical protein
MTQIARLDAFDLPFAVTVIKGEVLMVCPQAPLEIAFTAESAAHTGARLLAAASQAREAKPPRRHRRSKS